jgi:hypothetical protein
MGQNERVDIQVIGTDNSRHFYTQEQVDEQVRLARTSTCGEENPIELEAEGIQIWQDSDEWSVSPVPVEFAEQH